MKNNEQRSGVNSAANKAPRRTASLHHLGLARESAAKAKEELKRTKAENKRLRELLERQESNRVNTMTATIRDLRATIADRDLIIVQLKGDIANARKEVTASLMKVAGLQKSLVQMHDKNRRLINELHDLDR